MKAAPGISVGRGPGSTADLNLTFNSILVSYKKRNCFVSLKLASKNNILLQKPIGPDFNIK